MENSLSKNPMPIAGVGVLSGKRLDVAALEDIYVHSHSQVGIAGTTGIDDGDAVMVLSSSLPMSSAKLTSTEWVSGDASRCI